MTTPTPLEQGGVDLPLAQQATGASILRVADPFLYQALPFWQWALQNYLSGAYEAAMAGQALATAGTNACLTTAPTNPIPFIEGGSVIRPPLLACWPQKGQWEQFTLQRRHVKTTYSLAYVLPATDFDQMQRVGPLLQAVLAVLTLATEKQAIAAYTPVSGAAGDNVWHAAKVEAVAFNTYSFDAFLGTATKTYQPVLTAEVVVTKRDEWVEPGHDFLTTIASIGVGENEVGIFPDFIQIDTGQPIVTGDGQPILTGDGNTLVR